MKSTLVIGNGFLANHLNYQKLTKRVSIDNFNIIENEIDIYKPSVIINCIGKTGKPNVDYCENNKDETAFSNVILPVFLAELCAKKSIHFINIGSGCIYFGVSPNIDEDGNDTGWCESDFANPESYYSKTKYACDLAIASMKHVTTLRIRMPVSTKNTDRNLINKLRGYRKVIDIPNSMTFLNDLVRCVDWTIKRAVTGIFHVANPQPLTAARIMKEYQKYFIHHGFEIINENQLDQLTLAKRSNCILNTEKLSNAGFNMTPSEEALINCMREYVKNI